jgi:hypothetical protein
MYKLQTWPRHFIASIGSPSSNLGEYVRSTYIATSYETFVLWLVLEWVISSNKHYEDAWIQTKAVLII